MNAETQNRVPAAALPLASIALLACFLGLPVARETPTLFWSIAGAAGILLALLGVLRRQVARTGRALRYEFLPKPVHYVQLAMHSSIYAYWGWYWREVYRLIPLIIAEIVFFYALDMIVCWFRRDRWILGFGGVPIVLSTNLFLIFKPEWFFLQFLMVATGVLCKEFITWERDGRKTHVFNPSSIALSLFSLGLIFFRHSGLAWGAEIAVSFNNPPFIYIEIFLVGLIVQALFEVTLVTLSAAATLYLLNLAYTRATGIYYFIDTSIPAAVFLGLHLLVTDPATSPRKDLGKVVFGSLYGLCVWLLYWVLDPFDLSFYDKLLCVPFLNLTVRALDRASDSVSRRWSAPSWWPPRPNRAYMAVWIALFGLMMATGFLSGAHPGADPDFWRQACAQGRRHSCKTWLDQLRSACLYQSRRACVDLGTALSEGTLVKRDLVAAAKSFAHICESGAGEGCDRLLRLVEDSKGSFLQSACDGGDGESCMLLGSLYLQGGGVPADPARSVGLLTRSCSLGWARGCFGLGESYRAGNGTAVDGAQALRFFDKACSSGVAPSCFAAVPLLEGMHDGAGALARLKQGCELSVRYAQGSPAFLANDSLAKKSAVPSRCLTPFE